jgi:hypothetical protein
VGDVSRYSGLLHMKVSQTRVSQSDFKTGRGAMMGSTRGTIAMVV